MKDTIQYRNQSRELSVNILIVLCTVKDYCHLQLVSIWRLAATGTAAVARWSLTLCLSKSYQLATTAMNLSDVRLMSPADQILPGTCLRHPRWCWCLGHKGSLFATVQLQFWASVWYCMTAIDCNLCENYTAVCVSSLHSCWHIYNTVQLLAYCN